MIDVFWVYLWRSNAYEQVSLLAVVVVVVAAVCWV